MGEHVFRVCRLSTRPREPAGSVTLPSAPHDALFRALVSDRRRAAALLHGFLPEDVAATLDPGCLPEPVEGGFVDGEGARTQCDALFRVRLRDGRPAHVYVLIEHKSHPDLVTPLQLARYMLGIWTREVEERGYAADRRLTPIFPLVLYHGPGRWTAPLSLAEMVDAPVGAGDPLGGFGYTLRDLRRTEPGALPRRPDLLAGLLALREAFGGGISRELLDLITGGTVDGSDFERHVLLYVVERMELAPEALEASLRRTRPERWETLMGTVAQAWMEEGRAEGIAEGRAEGIVEGRAETFLRLARIRFGDVPERLVERVRSAEVETLDRWLESLVTAAALEEVFEPRGPH